MFFGIFGKGRGNGNKRVSRRTPARRARTVSLNLEQLEERLQPSVSAFLLQTDHSLLEQTSAGQTMLSPAGTILSISAATDSAGQADVFAVTSDRRLWEHTAAGWALLSTGSFQQISAARNAAGNTVVFAVLTNNSLWEYSSQFSGGWVMLSPAGTILSVSAVTDSAGHDDAFAVTTNYNLWEHSPNNGWVQLSTSSFEQVSAGLNGSGQAVVYGVLGAGAGGYANSLWEYDATLAGGWRMLSGPGTILSVSSGGANEVYAITADHRLWDYKMGNWSMLSTGDFTSISGTEAPASGHSEVYAVLADTSWWMYATSWSKLSSAGALASSGVTVSANLTATITGLPSSGDSPEGTKLTLGSSVSGGVGADTYSWIVTLNGTTVASGAGSSLAFTPTSTGTYQAALTVTDAANDKASASGAVVVDLAPTVSLGGPYSGQTGSAVTLTANASNPNSGEKTGFTYAWNFGDGATASGTSATDSHVYAAAGAYTATVTVTDSVGEQATSSATVTVSADLTATITGLPSSGYNLEGTKLTLGSSVSGGVGADAYSWVVTLNGTTVASGTAASLAFTPTSTGTYQAALTVTDAANDKASASGAVVVDLAPTVSLGGPYSGQTGSAVTLTANASNPNSGEKTGFTYAWNFGDGATASGTSATDSHVYAAAGTYTATVTATDSVGETATSTATVTVSADLTATITGLPSSGYSLEGTKLTLGSSVSGGVGADTNSWTVTLGGTTVASGAGSSLAFTPTSTGTYQAALTVTDAANDKALASGSVVVDLAPTVSLGGPYSGQTGSAVTLTANASNPNSGEAAGFTYSWVFGDGATASGTSATDSHVYAAAGTYTTTVTATDSVGETATASATVTVSADLTATITGLPSSGYSLEGTKLTLGSSVSGGTGADTYSWTVTLGGTTVASGAGSSLAFTPTSTGTYQAALTVTDAAKDTATASGSVVIDLPPTVSLGGPYSGQAGSAIGLTANASNPNAGEAAGFSYSWSFGDGKTASGTSATDSHVYAATGTYTATVTATDSVGETATASATVTVSADLTATITGLPSSGYSLEGTKLTLGSSVSGGVGADTYSWTVTLAGTTVASGAGSSLAFTPTSTGTYQVALTATDAAKDKASASGSVVIDLPPTVSLGGPYSGQAGSAIGLTANASNPNAGEAAGFSYSWSFGDGKTGSGTSATISHAYAATGAYTATVTATDSVGETATSSATVTVTSNLSVSITGLPASGYSPEGTQLTLGEQATGGTGADTYSWVVTLGGTTVASGSGASFSFTPANTGAYQVALTATDSAKDTATANGSLTADLSPTVSLGGPYTGEARASIALTASASNPNSGEPAGFTYAWNFGDGNTDSTTSPTDSHAYATAGTYTVTVTATDSVGETASSTATVSVSGSSSDTSSPLNVQITGLPSGQIPVRTQVTLGALVSNYPDYAQVNVTGESDYIWSGNTNDPRGLLIPGGGGVGIASCWYASTSFTVDINLTDGQQHQVALYFLDWDNSGRSERVDVLNADTGALLNSRTVSSFSGGQYLVYALSGHVQIRITNLAGSDSNAVLSGLFFDSPPANAPSGTAFLKSDTTTQGNWIGVYGGEGYYVVDTAPADQYSWTASQNGAIVASSTSSALSFTPGVIGTYQVAWTVTDTVNDNTASGSASLVVVGAPPTVTLGGPYSGQAGSAIAFTASASNPNTGEAPGFTYTWKFGDGATDSSASATDNHVYAAIGNYTVTVTATDSVGETASSTAVVTVSSTAPAAPAYIQTSYDLIPNFGANPTITALRSGNWSDPTMWSQDRLPVAGDVVSIGAGVTVTYDVASTANIDTVAIQAGGTLQFRTDISTELTVVNLLVMPGGTLTVGTTAQPVAAGVTAQIIFPDVPFNYTEDPSQYGHGLIGLGNVVMCGAAMNETWVQLAADAHAGDTTLTLAQPVSGWQVALRSYCRTPALSTGLRPTAPSTRRPRSQPSRRTA